MKKGIIIFGLFVFILLPSLLAGPLKEVKVLKPNGGEEYFKGVTIKIRWSATPAAATGRLFLIRSKGGEVLTIQKFTLKPIANSAHEIDWKIPNDVPDGTDYKIGVEVKYGVMTLSDYSDNHFTIKSLKINSVVSAGRQFARIRLISPNGGETIYKGESCIVEWETPDPIGRPKLSIIDGTTTVFDIFGILPEGPFAGNRFRYNLDIPVEIANGSNYKLKIFAADMFGTDISDGTFTITDER